MHKLAPALSCFAAIATVSLPPALAQKPKCQTGYAKAHKLRVGNVTGRAHYCIDREGRKDGPLVVVSLEGQQILASATYAADRRVGEYREWYASGQPRLLENYLDGQLVGVKKSWFENGSPRTECTLAAGRPDGICRGWTPEGQLVTEKSWRAGELHGASKSWNDEGVLLEEVTYKDGTLHGTRTTFYESGAKKGVQTYNENVLTGEKAWTEDGTEHKLAKRVGGHREGEHEERDGDGVVTEKGEYRAGVRVGHWTYFNRKTKVPSSEGTYNERGERHGVWTFYDESYLRESNYERGKLHGPTRYYDGRELVRTVTYDRGDKVAIGSPISARFTRFGLGVDVGPSFGANGAVVEGRLNMLAQIGTARERLSGKFSGTYLSAGVEGTVGGRCRSSGGDYCPDYESRTTIGPTFRANWGRGNGKGLDTVKIYPGVSLYAKVTPFVSFMKAGNGFGVRGGIGVNAPWMAKEILVDAGEDDGEGQVGSLGVLLAIPAALFTHIELFAEGERMESDNDVRFGFAVGFGM